MPDAVHKPTRADRLDRIDLHPIDDALAASLRKRRVRRLRPARTGHAANAPEFFQMQPKMMSTRPMFNSLKIFAAAAGLIGMIPAGPALAAGQHAGGHGHAMSFGEPGTTTQATRTIEITAKDHTFSPPAIQVKAGETVRFVIRNAGEFLHEFNIGTPAMHAEHQKEMMQMMEHGMLTPTGINTDMSKMDHSKAGGHSMKHDDPNSVLVEPGETKELVWKFSRAADLQFACNVPGHYESGMVGPIQFGR